MKVKLTSEDEEKIYELYKNGISMKNIANQYGTSFNKISKTINNYCFTHNVPKPIPLQERKTKQLPLTMENIYQSLQRNILFLFLF